MSKPYPPYPLWCVLRSTIWNSPFHKPRRTGHLEVGWVADVWSRKPPNGIYVALVSIWTHILFQSMGWQKRENLQETIDFRMKMGLSCTVMFPFNQSIDSRLWCFISLSTALIPVYRTHFEKYGWSWNKIWCFVVWFLIIFFSNSNISSWVRSRNKRFRSDVSFQMSLSI